MSRRCLIIDHDHIHARSLAGFCAEEGYEAVIADSIENARQLTSGPPFDLAFIELDLPDGSGLKPLQTLHKQGAEILMMGSQDEHERANRVMSEGALYFFCKPFEPERLRMMLRDIAHEIEALSADPDAATSPAVLDQFGYLRGSSPGMRRLYRIARKVAPSDASLLLVGETGTGKEMLARTIHELSDRAAGPFVAFNCASVTETLIESELFGHEKGSFSGASKMHRGFFERAASGTLMLDEITEMSLELQARLLRVLEEKRLRRIGSEVDIDVDVRIISATNRSPEQAMEEGRLRKDLYFRIAQFPLELPPLRERGNDIGGLAQYFLGELNLKHDTNICFSEDALDKIAQHPWPGNIRQLKYAVERAYIVASSLIEGDMLPDPDQQFATLEHADSTIRVPRDTTLAEMERIVIEHTLQQNQGNKKLTADQLGVSLKTLYNRLNEYAATTDAVDNGDFPAQDTQEKAS